MASLDLQGARATLHNGPIPEMTTFLLIGSAAAVCILITNAFIVAI